MSWLRWKWLALKHDRLRWVCHHEDIVGVHVTGKKPHGPSEEHTPLVICDFDKSGALCSIEVIGLPEHRA